MKNGCIGFLLAVAMSVCAGCNLIVPAIFIGEGIPKVVPAEYSRLENTKTLVLVWAKPETLFDYPHIRHELSSYVAHQLRRDVKNLSIVEPIKVEDYLHRSASNNYFDPVKIGQDFQADAVVYLEVLQFQIRDPHAPDYLQGRIESSVVVYDLRAGADQNDRFELSPVSVEYPEGQPVTVTQSSPDRIRQQTYEKYAFEVSKRFHEYKETIK